MCGIVGLFLKDPSLEAALGRMLTDMLVTMSDRGPDSAGIAIYSKAAENRAKITIQSAHPDQDFAALEADFKTTFKQSLTLQRKTAMRFLKFLKTRSTRYAPECVRRIPASE